MNHVHRHHIGHWRADAHRFISPDSGQGPSLPPPLLGALMLDRVVAQGTGLLRHWQSTAAAWQSWRRPVDCAAITRLGSELESVFSCRNTQDTSIYWYLPHPRHVLAGLAHRP